MDTQINTDSVTNLDGNLIPVRVGRKRDSNWALPCIGLYYDSTAGERYIVGSNARDNRDLLIIDIYASNESERLALAKWVTDTINDGFRFYTYTYNEADPEAPTKVAGGLIQIDFVTNNRVKLGQNVDIFDAYRHQITINTYLTGA